MKKCSTCKVEKNEEEFSFKSKKSGKRVSRCKACHSDYMKLHYKNNKDVYVERAKISSPEYIRQRRQWLAKYKSAKGCAFCPEKEPCCLDFHHTSCDKQFDISSGLSKRWKEVLKEVEKCQVICSNCHRKIHAGKLEVAKATSS